MDFNVLRKTYAMFFKTRLELGYKNSRTIAELSCCSLTGNIACTLCNVY